MTAPAADLLTAVTAWLKTEPAAEAAIIYGSKARDARAVGGPDRWSDIDLHVITSAPGRLLHTDWKRALPDQEFCLQARRSAAGGVPKLTVLFKSGELEMVLLPASGLWWGRLAMTLGWHQRIRPIREGMNVLATGLRTGYRFLKGEAQWGAFYARLVREMPGLRLSDEEVRRLADVFLCDVLCVLGWIERGELAAAQNGLHQRLAATNFSLLREWRLRRGWPLPSFEIGRRVETLLDPAELAWVRVEARVQREELQRATWQALDGLKNLMRELSPQWAVPPAMGELLAAHGGALKGRAG
jgi:hypothetical protein